MALMCEHHISEIVTFVSVIISTGFPVSAEVQYLRSPLAATGRAHACQGEPLTFTCEVHGQFIQWTFSSHYRTTFFENQNVNTVQMVSGRHGIRAVLTGNDALPGNLLARSLRSALIIDSPLSGYSHNISCSSDTSMQTYRLQIAEIPSLPQNVSVSKMAQSSKQISRAFSLTWEEPENTAQFDLEYFQISLFVSQPSITETGTQYTVNATTTELGYHFILTLSTVEYIMVTAISKCSHELSDPAIWTNSEVIKSHQVTTTSHADTVKDPRDYTTPNFNNGFKRELPEKGLVSSLLACALTVTRFFH